MSTPEPVVEGTPDPGPLTISDGQVIANAQLAVITAIAMFNSLPEETREEYMLATANVLTGEQVVDQFIRLLELCGWTVTTYLDGEQPSGTDQTPNTEPDAPTGMYL